MPLFFGPCYATRLIFISIGTIKHAQLAAIAHNREVIARYRTLARASEREIEALQD